MKKCFALAFMMTVVMVLGFVSPALPATTGINYYYYVEHLDMSRAPLDGPGYFPSSGDYAGAFKSPGDGTRTTYFSNPFTYGFPDVFVYSLDGLSFSSEITRWLYQIENGWSSSGKYPAIHYSFQERMDLGDFSLNSMILTIDTQQAEEQLIRYTDLGGVGANADPWPQGYDADTNDFMEFPRWTESGDPTTPPSLIYLSVTKKVGFDGTMHQISAQRFDPTGYLTFTGTLRGSAAGTVATGGRLHEADVIIRTPTGPSSATYSYFVTAYRLAECLLYPGTTTRPFEDLGYVWDAANNYFMTSGRVEDGAGNGIAGYDAIRNFIRYVMDIDSIVVEDVDGDGEFDAGVDKLLFSLVDDGRYGWMQQWGLPGYVASVMTPFNGRYFDGTTIFLYDGYNVTTFFDPGTSVFFGDVISTTPATLWAGAYFPYELDGLEIYLVPEPSTIYLMIGSATGLAVIASILRKRLH